MSIDRGEIFDIEPRFRGNDLVAPREEDDSEHQFSSWERSGSQAVHFRTRTRPNPTTTTDATQSFCLQIVGDDATRVAAIINGREVAYSIGELRTGPRSGHLGGFLTPAYQFHRAVPIQEYRWSTTMTDEHRTSDRDHYYVRVRQKNDQWAWSSPIWV